MISPDIFESQYRNRRIFVTGHTGFKGSWLIYWLRRLGADVRGYALAAPAGELYELIDGDTLCDSVIGDVRDAPALHDAIADFDPEYAFHLAAQSLVGKSYESPLETFDVNVMGTANFLAALRSLPGRCSAVVVTTDKVYENLETGKPFAIDDKLGGHDPYSASKACAEIVSDSFRKSFFAVDAGERHRISIATARAGNVIGGGDWNENHLVPDIVNALRADEEIAIRNPESVRPWQHVVEPLAGYLLLALRLSEQPEQFGKAWNFGPDLSANVSVESFVERAIRYWGAGRYAPVQRDDAPHEAGLLRLDISATVEELGWGPVFPVDEAIERTLDWYRRLLADDSPASALIDSDLDAYRAACVRI